MAKRGKVATGSYAGLFGRTATGMLVALAHAPGAREIDLCNMLGLDYPTFNARMKRLKQMKLVVGDYFYELNPKIEHHHLLLDVLLKLGPTFNFKRERAKLRKLPGRGTPTVASLPSKLFGTDHTTNILMFVAALGETYPSEIAHAFSMEGLTVLNLLKVLVADGVLEARRFKQAVFYRFIEAQPAYGALLTLLRGMAGNRKRAVNAVNITIVRREQLKFFGSRRELEMMDALSASSPKRAVTGVKLAAGIRVRKQLVRQARAAIWGR